jgi:conjugal transfer mating pair stabilization protein TraN
MNFKSAVKLHLIITMLIWSALAEAQSNSCRKTGTVCSQGPQTRTINGYAVYKACWQETDTYECYDSSVTDTCGPLRAKAGCFELSASCAETNYQGQCIRFATVMRCDHFEAAPAGVTARPPVFSIVSELLTEAAQCQTLKTDSNCVKTGSVCSQGPATRSCWETTDTYACVGTVGAINFCQPLQAQPVCREVTGGGFPACSLTAANGQCIKYDRRYVCDAVPTVPLPPSITVVNTVVNVVQDVWQQSQQCQTLIGNGQCRKTGSICTEGPATRLINGVSTYKDCWKQQDTYTCDQVGGGNNYCAPLEAK